MTDWLLEEQEWKGGGMVETGGAGYGRKRGGGWVEAAGDAGGAWQGVCFLDIWSSCSQDDPPGAVMRCPSVAFLVFSSGPVQLSWTVACRKKGW